MKIKAGIVGPKDTVNLICNISKEYDEKLHPIPFIYKDAEETAEIVQKNEQLVDVWIFSGLTPYTYAKKSSSKQLFFYLKLDGSSLANVLIKIGYKDRKKLDRISIDMLTERDVYETYNDLDILHENLYLYEYPGHTPTQDIVHFHQSLFNEGKVDVCATCLHSVYEQLQSLNIPVYRITPTRTNIRQTLETAFQQWETQHFKQSQIAVMLIKTGSIENIANNNTMSYDLHRLNLRLQSAILDYAESISGSFISLAIGEYIVFSTRGSLLQKDTQGLSLLEKLALITDFPSNVGIGYGDTSLAAEENARLALHHAQDFGGFCAFLVDDNGIIEGPLKEQESIAYGYRTEDKEISARLKQAGVTITTYNKVLSIQKSLGNQAITAFDVAEWLKMTQRNARRILNSLVEHGLAEIIGEEAPSSRGRPRKIYRVVGIH